jgi:hypothetical protein
MALMVFTASVLNAQVPKVFFACYVPSSGTVYRIKEPNTPLQCGTSTKRGVTVQHVEFSWTDGAGGGGASDHGALAGLTDDDHAQYLLADGVRSSTNGFAVTGTVGAGSIPASGGGARLMWYPGKAALRVGLAAGQQWDDANIGLYSMALGSQAMATGQSAGAFGSGAYASGQQATAFTGSTATGWQSLAAGGGVATGDFAVAIGNYLMASGERSVALGTLVSTNGKKGAFVYGDASTMAAQGAVNALTDNHFVVRAGRFWFGNDNNVTATVGRFIETSTGAYLSSGGTWTNSSDSTKKTSFREIDGDALLAKLTSMPVRTWRYRAEDSTVRHMGPTAQEFRAAFSLGDSDKAIATVDADGVSLAAIQALVKRTDRLTRENDALRRTNAGLRSDLGTLEERIGRIEAQVAQLAAPGPATAAVRR